MQFCLFSYYNQCIIKSGKYKNVARAHWAELLTTVEKQRNAPPGLFTGGLAMSFFKCIHHVLK
jgi:hypothetical protein